MTTGITVRIDPDKCHGHAWGGALAGNCSSSMSFGNAREALKSCLPPELVEKAFIARANCPEEAIIIDPEGRSLIVQGFETVAGLEASMRSVLRLPTPPVTGK
jgi:ferredoxin